MSSASDSDNAKDNYVTPKKKVKKLCKFQDAWLENADFKDWIVKIIEKPSYVYCKFCRVEFNIGYGGIRALKVHANTNKHSQNKQSVNKCNVMNKFFPTKKSGESESCIISELILTFHAIKHHHSYLSQDCGNKLQKTVFEDSKIAQKTQCGKTKSEALVELVLAPHSLELVLKEVENSPYSICTDASNKGNKKMFPVVIRYFHKEKGTQNAILDFYEDPNESSRAIADQLIKCIQDNGLGNNKLVSYGADNASVNFGKFNSVFVHLKTDLNWPSLVAGHCNAHILHNTAKFGLKLLPYDVENLVLKVFAEFSSSAKNLQTLKDFCTFVEVEYSTILRHVPTRFLSFYPAVDKLLLNWPALKSYFLSEG